MADPAAMLTLITAGTAGISITSAAALRGWNGWLDLKRMELAGLDRKASPPSPATTSIRAESRARSLRRCSPPGRHRAPSSTSACR